MKSTVRFTGTGEYQCKQLNLVSAVSSDTNVETVGGNNVLVVKDQANIKLDTEFEDKDFTITVKNISIYSVSNAVPLKRISGYISLGYTRYLQGTPFMIPVTTTPADLVITKINGTLTVVYDGNVICIINNQKGPVREMGLRNLLPIHDYELRIGDIIYESI